MLPVGLYYEKMNNVYRGGTPDVWYSGTLDDLWVEYKWIPKLPVRGVVDLLDLLSPLQAKWLGDRMLEGRNVAIVVGSPKGSWFSNHTTLRTKINPEEFTYSRLDVANWIRRKTMAP